MTREEAIKILEGLMVPICAEEAFDMAIEALKQPEIIYCHECIHYNAGFECLKEGYGIEYSPNYFCADAKRREEGEG